MESREHELSLPQVSPVPLFSQHRIMCASWQVWHCAIVYFLLALLQCCVHLTLAYDPNDTKIAAVLPPEGMFEAFYPREMDGVLNSASRPAHAHGSFFKHRNPALVDTKNAAAYGYRFDGKRRFNFD